MSETEISFMWQTFFYALIYGVAMFLCGAHFGAYTEKRKWQRNAKDYKRIESGGQLYKVVPDRDYAFYKFLEEGYRKKLKVCKPSESQRIGKQPQGYA